MSKNCTKPGPRVESEGYQAMSCKSASMICRDLVLIACLGIVPATPEGDHAEVTGTGSLGPFLSGIILPKSMASPRGLDAKWDHLIAREIRAA